MAGKKGKGKNDPPPSSSSSSASTKLDHVGQTPGGSAAGAEKASKDKDATRQDQETPGDRLKNGLPSEKHSAAGSKVRRMSTVGARCASYILARRRFSLVVGLFVGLAVPWAGHNLGIWDTELPLQGCAADDPAAVLTPPLVQFWMST